MVLKDVFQVIFQAILLLQFTNVSKQTEKGT